MKKSLITAISLTLVAATLTGMLASCRGNEENTADTDTTVTERDTATESVHATESESDGTTYTDAESNGTHKDTDESKAESETESIDETDTGISLEGEHAALIELNNSMANGVQAYFADASRTHFNLSNKNMTVSYSRASVADQLVASLTNSQGKTYVQNTMDVFIKMKDGKTYYASQSSRNAEVNLYRFGYYYYEGLFEFQNFVSKNVEVTDTVYIDSLAPDRTNNVTVKKSNSQIAIYIKNVDDPYFIYDGLELDADKNNTLVFTAKATEGVSRAQVYFTTDTYTSFSEDRMVAFPLINDGQSHTYTVSLDQIADYSGTLTSLRFDVNGSIKDCITVTSIGVGYANTEGAPTEVSINRHFHVYSDKMHHTVQFAATKETENVAEVGMVTRIAADTVEKLMLYDKNGEHNDIDKVDWASCIAVGFDIKDAGIFGFILPKHEAAGSIKVTLEGDSYVIVQSRVPEDNTLIPSVGGVDEDGNYVHDAGVENNGNDFYLGQRIYTDESHDFTDFLFQVYCEQNSLILGKNVKVSQAGSTAGEFEGYDALRGIYVLKVGSFEDFWDAYNKANKNCKVNFTITSDQEDRDIYIMTSASNGLLECAALLDDELMMLPIPIQVTKNFSEISNGERNLFNISDPAFSEAVFMLSLNKGERYTYTILNLYQNWGKFPLKQLSQIPFHMPYYHLSTGVTETNCITPWFKTDIVGKGAGGSTLPDFRCMSSPFWAGQPQHTHGGTHSWLKYTTASGQFSTVESTCNTITSYGPTYAEVIMDNVTDDGAINVTYTHMEMPQTDENRVYYTIEYSVVKELEFNDFKNDFTIYEVTDNDSTGYYTRLGYLNESNECTVTETARVSGKESSYVLGKNCPYFSLFEMKNYGRDAGYTNLAFLIYTADMTIGGEKADPDFMIFNSGDSVRLSLNLDKVTLKAGDKITINAILLPWGSQHLDGTYDTIRDKNVRDVRENTLLSPLTVTSESDRIEESPFLPKITSADGKSAQFTLSGGENNVAVRVYGFDMLTAPKIEELVDGKWTEYSVNSASSPDEFGYYHYYDGYGVYYDGDGTYSYSFVTTMTGGKARTFRISADTEFEGWPTEVEPEIVIDPLKVYIDPEELRKAISGFNSWFGEGTGVSADGSYITFTGSGNPKRTEVIVNAYAASKDEDVESGQYIVFKYRISKTNSEDIGVIEFFTSTVNEVAVKGDSFMLSPICDGEWHVAVIDVTKTECPTFQKNEDGYYAKYLRVDIFNKVLPQTVAIDVAYLGMESDLEVICELNARDFKYLDYYDNGTRLQLNVQTCAIVVPRTLKVNVTPEMLKTAISKFQNWFGEGTGLSADNSYFTFTGSGNPDRTDVIVNAYTAPADSNVESGRYIVFKYRIPEANTEDIGEIEFFTSTKNSSAKPTDYFKFAPISDGEWHVAVIDVTKTECATFKENEGGYYAKYLRVDIFNKALPSTVAIDVALVGMEARLSDVCEICGDGFEYLDYYENGNFSKLNVSTGEIE